MSSQSGSAYYWHKARSALATARRTASPYMAALFRRARQRPLRALTVAVFALLLFALLLFQIAEYSGLGRWYWNYAVTFHPALAYVLPFGNWGPVEERRPRWVPEIYDSTWAGAWEPPVLSRPRYAATSSSAVHGGHTSESGNGHHALHDTITAHDNDDNEAPPVVAPFSEQEPDRRDRGISRQFTKQHKQLVSPAILKLHVFSTAVSEKAYKRRQLFRELSPLHQLPPEYRHLVELKFVLGYPLQNNGWDENVDEEAEARLQAEQAEHGDLFRLEGLWRGENLREGKILQWIRDVGLGKDSPRHAWYLFKLDDDAVVNLPNLLDLLTSLNVHEPTYLGTSLARWPPYHFHFTGFLTGFNYGVYKTLSEGINKMPKEEVQASFDDDVLTGEIMWSLPSAPHCRPQQNSAHSAHVVDSLPDYCDPNWVPPWGMQPAPPNPDPRTDLNRLDFVRRAADPDWVGAWFSGGDLATHSWWFKFEERYRAEWAKRIQGRELWDPPNWIKKFADPAIKADM